MTWGRAGPRSRSHGAPGEGGRFQTVSERRVTRPVQWVREYGGLLRGRGGRGDCVSCSGRDPISRARAGHDLATPLQATSRSGSPECCHPWAESHSCDLHSPRRLQWNRPRNHRRRFAARRRDSALRIESSAMVSTSAEPSLCPFGGVSGPLNLELHCLLCLQNLHLVTNRARRSLPVGREFYRLPLARLCVMQSIWQLSRFDAPPFDHAVTWSASISSSL